MVRLQPGSQRPDTLFPHSTLFRSRAGDGLRIEVHDTGPGIEPAQQAAIFEEFRRGDGAAGQGLGLGLAIADRIAQLLQAPLTLRSGNGRGTVFALAVPRAVTRAPAAAAGKKGIAGTRVLIVDNEPAALQSLREIGRAHV